MVCNFISRNQVIHLRWESKKEGICNPLILKKNRHSKKYEIFQNYHINQWILACDWILSLKLLYFGLAYYSAFDWCKNHFHSTFLSKVANFLLRFSSLSWTNFEKLISGKYKHFSISFQRDQNFYRTTNDWKVIDKNKNTARLFNIDFR